MSGRSVLSVDFGTTKTYFSKCPADDPSPVSVDFGDGRDGIPSALLYRKGKVPLIGQTALDEYGEATSAERGAMRLVTNFKADLPRSEEARRAAADFLAAVLADARKQNLDIEPSGRQVLFGVPCEADESFHSALAEVARQGGFGTPDLVDEPKGALLYHLKQGDIPVGLALESVLVADFGGGTCDFALLEGGRTVHSWGDMTLGGRLFDDLFFQWLLDQNPGLESKLEEQGATYFVQSHLCREGKEFFSRSMARDRQASVSKVLPGYGRLSEMTWEEFLRRGQAYHPSAFFRRSFGDGRGTVLPDEGKDLFEWFRECLLSGLRKKGIASRRISLVVLAGGSSLWPFVPDILREELGLPEKFPLLRSDRPYTVISLGLALLPALKMKFSRTRQALSEELPRFLRDKAGPVLSKRCILARERMLTAAGNDFFQKKICPLLEDFRKNGGTLASLRRRLNERLAAEEPLLRETMEQNFPLLLAGLKEETRELAGEWFARHGVVAPPRDFTIHSSSETNGKEFLSLETPGMDGMVDILGGVLGGLVTAGTAMICGGSGTALVTAGPMGFAVGGVLGLSLSWLLAKYGREKVKEMAEDIELPPWIAAAVLSKRRINEAEKELKEALEAHLESRLALARKELEDHVRALVLDEIDALDEIGGF